MAKGTSAHNVYSLLVLFDFNEQPPGIASVSAIFKPTLCEDEKDVLALLSLWIESKRQVVVRWPKGDSSQWNLTLYLNNVEDSDHRVGVPICFSDDKDFLRQKKLDLNKLTLDNLQPKEKVATHSRRQLPYLAQPDQSSRRNHFEKENEDLKLKIQELKEQLEESKNSIMEDCKTKISTLEEELDQMALQLADRECEAIELREKLESLEKRKQSDDILIQLASGFQENMEKLQAIVNQQPPPFSSTPSRMSASASSSPRGSNPDELMVPFHANISISRASMRRILIAARLGKTEKDLNNTVTAILDAFCSPAELAEYSRTGKVCPTKPGTRPKKKFPEDILNAISGFLTSRWSTWHDGAFVEEATVHAAVGHRLLGCHTNTRKRKMRHPDLNGDEILNEELTRTNESLGL